MYAVVPEWRLKLLKIYKKQRGAIKKYVRPLKLYFVAFLFEFSRLVAFIRRVFLLHFFEADSSSTEERPKLISCPF